MGIDLQIAAHLGEQIVTNLFLSILESGEFLAEIQAAMASLSLVGDELAVDLLPPREPPYPAFEFRAPHGYHVRTLLSDRQAGARSGGGPARSDARPTGFDLDWGSLEVAAQDVYRALVRRPASITEARHLRLEPPSVLSRILLQVVNDDRLFGNFACLQFQAGGFDHGFEGFLRGILKAHAGSGRGENLNPGVDSVQSRFIHHLLETAEGVHNGKQRRHVAGLGHSCGAVGKAV
jgi:hypothetical protein